MSKFFIRKLLFITLLGLCLQMIALTIISALNHDSEESALLFVEKFYEPAIRIFRVITPDRYQFLGDVPFGLSAIFFSFFLYALLAGLAATGLGAARGLGVKDNLNNDVPGKRINIGRKGP